MSELSSIRFTELFGQEKAKRLFSRSLMAGRVPHAYLFRGPDGVGKRLFAQGVAAAINCHSRSGVAACGNCSSCRKFRSQNHPDCQVIRPRKGVIKIEQIRQLTKELSYPPFESETRIVVLEDVHTMRREAANSLLKTLEEPPPNNLLILTAESSQEILATLISRCQVVPFTQLSTSDTAAILVAHGVESDAAVLLARLSEGSPGRALLFQKSDMIGIWREVVSVLSDPAVLPDRDVGVLLRLAEKMAGQKEDLPSFLGLLKIWVRDLLLAAASGEDAAKDDFRPRKSWSSTQLFAKLQAISRADRELARNCNRNLVCEVLLFGLQ
ncbi:MAG: DNA polymerase III subunit delta' [Pseudomonadota bacterium]